MCKISYRRHGFPPDLPPRTIPLFKGSSTLQVDSGMVMQQHRTDESENGGIQRLSNTGRDCKYVPRKVSTSQGADVSHQSHGGARAHEQPHVKTEAAAGGGRRASLYMRLAMRAQSPVRSTALPSPAACAKHQSRNPVPNPLATSKNLFKLDRVPLEGRADTAVAPIQRRPDQPFPETVPGLT